MAEVRELVEAELENIEGIQETLTAFRNDINKTLEKN